MLSVIMLSVFILNFIMLSVIMLNFIKLSVMLSVALLIDIRNVIMLCVVMLSVIMVNLIMLNFIILSVGAHYIISYTPVVYIFPLLMVLLCSNKPEC
jgi:hypothetical protein